MRIHIFVCWHRKLNSTKSSVIAHYQNLWNDSSCFSRFFFSDQYFISCSTQAPVFSGTPVTLETFKEWKAKFMAEKGVTATQTDESQGKLTGRCSLWSADRPCVSRVSELNFSVCCSVHVERKPWVWALQERKREREREREDMGVGGIYLHRWGWGGGGGGGSVLAVWILISLMDCCTVFVLCCRPGRQLFERDASLSNSDMRFFQDGKFRPFSIGIDYSR